MMRTLQSTTQPLSKIQPKPIKPVRNAKQLVTVVHKPFQSPLKTEKSESTSQFLNIHGLQVIKEDEPIKILISENNLLLTELNERTDKVQNSMRQLEQNINNLVHNHELIEKYIYKLEQHLQKQREKHMF
ncbi:Hypothetical_protein [Hexamita inflata]|uniref:Hypothetical_protein n=1 Tax=Hexamita inflata TaxID=28002 RepID=A0AA86NF63_9EUKA|nr:Hypothetical protein HINF_LOCUS5833 [Hexamita inflata]